MKDKLWFYVAARRERHDIYSGGFTNLNASLSASDVNSWKYVQGPTATTNDGVQRSANVRVTWQASPRNKFSYFYDNQYRCLCLRNLTPLLTPEATSSIEYPYTNITAFTWSSPLTNRLLIEAGFLWHPEEWHYPLHDLDKIGVVDQGLGNLTYRGQIMVNSNGQFPDAIENAFNYRASVLVRDGFARDQGRVRGPGRLAGHFDRWQQPQPELPVQFSVAQRRGSAQPADRVLDPEPVAGEHQGDLGIYVQDRWTVKKLTANLGLRFDYFNTYFPPQTIGPSLYTPNRNLNFPETPWVAWKDFTPRMGVVYDVFGNGKTAVKASLNKYVLATACRGCSVTAATPSTSRRPA